MSGVKELRSWGLLIAIALSLVFGMTFLSMSAKAASGNVHYVATNGDDNNPGTETEPFYSIQKAADLANPGDTVLVREGTYAGVNIFGKHGRADAWIVFKPYQGERVVIDINLNPTTHWRGFHIDCSSYIEINGFVITDTNPLYDSDDPDDFRTGLSHGAFKISNYEDDPPHHIRIIGNEMVRIGGGGILTSYESHHIEVIGNYVHNVGLSRRGCGMYIGGDDHIIRGNRITDANSYGIHVYSEGGPTPDRVLVENNVIFDTGTYDYGVGDPYWEGTGRSGDGIYCGGGGSDCVIRNNLIFGVVNWGIRTSSRNAKVYNNTVFGNGYTGIYVYDNKNISLKNNLSFENRGEGGYPADYRLGSGNISDHNSWDLGIEDALFVDPENGDFRLHDGSPAIDAGVALDGFDTDIDGTPRPQGAGWDLGAYEYADLPTPTFADVPLDHWAHDYIEALYQEGYVAGCSTEPLMYCPEGIMTRAESAVFVERGVHGAEYLPVQPAEQIFADVPLNEWFAKWSAAIWDEGYTGGCGTDPLIFCPLQQHTRAEGSVFFLRMMHGVDYVPPDPEGVFADVSLDWWGAKWVEAAYNADIIPACETDPALKFCPEDPLDRAMGAYMMVQAKGLSVP